MFHEMHYNCNALKEMMLALFVDVFTFLSYVMWKPELVSTVENKTTRSRTGKSLIVVPQDKVRMRAVKNYKAEFLQ